MIYFDRIEVVNMLSADKGKFVSLFLSVCFSCYFVLKGLYHWRVVIQVCLQIDPDSYEWSLSARSVDLKWNPQRRMIKGELNRLCLAISSVSLFLQINITQIEASMTLFAFVILISQFLENEMVFLSKWIRACYSVQVRAGVCRPCIETELTAPEKLTTDSNWSVTTLCRHKHAYDCIQLVVGKKYPIAEIHSCSRTAT